MRKISAILLKKGVFEPMKKILTTAVLLTALVSCGRTTNTDNQPMSDTSGYSSNDISPTDRDDKIDRYDSDDGLVGDADHDKSITDDDIDRADHDSRDNTITDHAKDAVDGAENAGEDIIDSVGEAGKDIVDGAGDVADDIIDGIDGDISSDTSSTDTQMDTDVNTTAQVDTLTSE